MTQIRKLHIYNKVFIVTFVKVIKRPTFKDSQSKTEAYDTKFQ